MKTKPEFTIDGGGTKRWRLNDKLHREDGPAIEYADGSKAWLLNGEYHREDGPSFIGDDGSKEWRLNDKLHREGGPAIEWGHGTKEWWLNGQRHRENGPAVEYVDGSKFWYINGKGLTEEEYEQKTTLYCLQCNEKINKEKSISIQNPKRSNLYFHEVCFQEVAGKRFL